MKMVLRWMAMLCAVLTVLTCAVAVSADATKGTITIKNAVEKQTYSVYLMAELESYSGTSYSYRCVDAWKSFFGESGYFTVTDDGYISLKEGAELTDADKAKLAKDALAYAETNEIAATSVKNETASTTVVFEGLTLGYYLVDSSLGALCGLTTTDPNGEVNEKNGGPTVEKKVEEDSTGEFGSKNDADIGQTVNFKTTIHVANGAVNYVLHDKMDEGLTFSGSVKVLLNGTEIPATVTDGSTDPATVVTNYTPVISCTDGCTFELVFSDSFLADLGDGDTVVVEYSATLNEKAVVGSENGNLNETWLKYGDDNETKHATTETYVYAFDLIKTDTENKLLDGAKFQLLKNDQTTAIALVKVGDGQYRVATENDTDRITEFEAKDGKATISGLDSDTYYLKETVAPTGYNRLTSLQEFKIDGANVSATFENGKYASGGVQVINKTGTELPETGGFGTTMFLLIGGGLALCAGVLLVTKKRMSGIAD